MAEQFYTILTSTGKAKIANATALGTKLNLTAFKVGDGSGSYYNPTESQETLKNVVWEGSVSSITVDADNPNWIVLQAIIPGDFGGFMIREAGVFDDTGKLIAVGKYPETYKPLITEGSSKDLLIKMILEVSNTASVTLKVDSTTILATKKDLEVLSIKMNEFNIKLENSIVVSKDQPLSENNIFWLHDVGENFSIPTGDGVVIANAGFGQESPIQFIQI